MISNNGSNEALGRRGQGVREDSCDALALVKQLWSGVMNIRLTKIAAFLGVVALIAAVAIYRFNAQQLQPNPAIAAVEKPMILLKGGSFLMGTAGAAEELHHGHSAHVSPASTTVKD